MSLMSILTIILVILIITIIILLFIYLSMTIKGKDKGSKDKKENVTNKQSENTSSYTKLSIFDFMQFDEIEDNMIIQDKGTKYLMVLKCEGINYDLMSNIEKTSVEAGFVQFLNTLRYPIQLYTQTRTINISESLSNYKSRTDAIKKELDTKQLQYNNMLKKENIDQEKLEELKREKIRIKNLYEYGQDVITNIQKTNQNKNVLRKNYYIVIPCYSSELGVDLLKEDEKLNMIFSELYTRAQSMISALMSCEIKSKILNSEELAELLYVAYNRDDYETFGVDKALQSGYGELYSTAPDVLDKKMKALDENIQTQAEELANDAIEQVMTEKARDIKKKEDNIEDLIFKLAEKLIEENKKNMGTKVAEDAINKIKNKKVAKEGGKTNDKKTKTRTNAGE